jgi:hypothetical protein
VLDPFQAVYGEGTLCHGMRYQPETFGRILPQVRAQLAGFGGPIPQLLDSYDRYVRRLGVRCIYARATLKLIFLEAQRGHREQFEITLRTHGYE